MFDTSGRNPLISIYSRKSRRKPEKPHDRARRSRNSSEPIGVMPGARRGGASAQGRRRPARSGAGPRVVGPRPGDDRTLGVDRPQIAPGLPIAVPELLASHDSRDGPRDDPPHDDGAGVVEPDEGVGSRQDEVLHLRVVAVDDPAGLSGCARSPSRGTRHAGSSCQSGLMEDRIELDVLQGEAVGQLAGERRLPCARAADDQDATHACILVEHGTAILHRMSDLDAWEQLGTYRELGGSPHLHHRRAVARRGAPRAAPDPPRLPDRVVRLPPRARRPARAPAGLPARLPRLRALREARHRVHARRAGRHRDRVHRRPRSPRARAAHARHGRHRRRRGARAQHADGDWPVDITQRVLTNGSIYIEMAHLSAGQELLLEPPRRASRARARRRGVGAGRRRGHVQPAVDRRATRSSPRTRQLVTRDDGHLILPRLIRYIEERRRDQHRYTGAIETHPSPLHVVWGADDPIAVVAMVDRLRAARARRDRHASSTVSATTR